MILRNDVYSRPDQHMIFNCDSGHVEKRASMINEDVLAYRYTWNGGKMVVLSSIELPVISLRNSRTAFTSRVLFNSFVSLRVRSTT